MLEKSDFKKLIKSEDSKKAWSCFKCNCTIFPFNNHDITLEGTNSTKTPNAINISDHNSYEIDYLDNGLNCKFYDVNSFNSLSLDKESISFLHLNISSISKHLNSLEAFISSLNFNFKVIGISETRIFSKNTCYSMDGYDFFQTPTESMAGGTSLFICKSYMSIRRTDLEKSMYLAKSLESTFCEIPIKNQPNVIVGTIYKHPLMPVTEFSTKYLVNLLDKISKEGKLLVLLGDFNINLMQHKDPRILEFIDTLGSYLITPLINKPTRISSTSKTLIDNILISSNTCKIISGNFSTAISDHLIQFAVLNKSVSTPYEGKRTYKNWKKFDSISFADHFNNVNWEEYLCLENNNPNLSFDKFYDKLSELLRNHVPIKKLTKKQINKTKKPWITKDIIKLIHERDKLFKKFIRAKIKIKKATFTLNIKNIATS